MAFLKPRLNFETFDTPCCSIYHRPPENVLDEPDMRAFLDFFNCGRCMGAGANSITFLLTIRGPEKPNRGIDAFLVGIDLNCVIGFPVMIGLNSRPDHPALVDALGSLGANTPNTFEPKDGKYDFSLPAPRPGRALLKIPDSNGLGMLFGKLDERLGLIDGYGYGLGEGDGL